MLLRGLLILLVSLMANEMTSFARIGETEERCIQRYGSPVQQLEKGLLFLKDGKKIYITFINGIADSICVQRLSPGFEQRVVPLRQPEIQQILAENCQGCLWKYFAQLPDGDEVWMTRNSELGALYSRATLSFHIYTRESMVR